MDNDARNDFQFLHQAFSLCAFHFSASARQLRAFCHKPAFDQFTRNDFRNQAWLVFLIFDIIIISGIILDNIEVLLEEMAGTHMMDLMLNPLRMRIIQTLASCGNMTTAEICAQINDVPRTTVYRHIKLLLDHDVLKIVSEERIRGSLERTLAIHVDTLKRNNTLENASNQAFSFLMAKYVAFHRYISSNRANPEQDRVFLNNTILMATDGEYDQFLSELRDLLIKYSPPYAEGRKPRDFSILSIPANGEKDNQGKRQNGEKGKRGKRQTGKRQTGR